MRFVTALAIALFALLSVPTVNFSQGGQMEASRGVEGGGICPRLDRKDRRQRRSCRHDAQ